METLFVRDLMTSPVITISPETRLPAIKHVMRSNNIRRLPVVVDDRLVGIISFGDVRNAFPSDATTLSIYELSYLLDKVTAADVMRTGVMTIDADAPLVEAAQQMLKHKISGMPVLSGDRLVGMLTESDIFRALIAGRLQLHATTLAATDDRPLRMSRMIV